MRGFLATGLAVLLGSGVAFAAEILVVPGEGTPLQDAFDQAADGDTIVIKKGVYNESVSMSDRSNITIIGKGKVIIDGGDDGDAMAFDNINGLTISRITVRNAGDDGIDTSGCQNVLVSKCSFEDCGDSGVEDVTSNGIVIEKCKFTRVSWGVAISYQNSSGSEGIRISKNTMADVESVGVQFAGNDAVVEKNKMKNVMGDGIVVDSNSSWTGSTIEKNSIAAGADSGDGIVLNGTDHDVLKNKIMNPGGNGIDLSGGGMNYLEKNSIKGAGESGIYLPTANNELVKNKASGSGNRDLESTVDEDQNTFEKNKFKTVIFPE